MVYLLKHVDGPDFFYLISGKENIVGRKNADIVINNDQSISRKHAVIKVNADTVKLLDCGSKYGTSHNNTRISPNTDIIIKDKDVIKFGVFQSSYRLEKMNMVTTGSGLTNEQKTDLKKKLALLGASLVNNWEDKCTILTAQEIMLTIKVLHAVIDGKPIVTLAYWDQYIKNFGSKKSLPNTDDFMPPIAESLINRVELSVNPGRKVLFKDKIFVFLTEKVKNRMSDLIIKTGGSSISWEKQPLTLSQVTKATKSYLFIQSEELEAPRALKAIHDHIAKLGERTIPLQEIVMAIVNCSCEKDCNPKFNRLHNVFINKPVASESAIFPLASETPSDFVSLDQNITKQEVIIPESLDTDLQLISSFTPTSSNVVEKPAAIKEYPFAIPHSTSSLKQKNTEPEQTPSKRIKLDINSVSPIESVASTKKRKADEHTDPPAKKSQTLRENPFALLKNKTPVKRNIPDNPFSALRVKQEVSVNNPFRKVIESAADGNQTATASTRRSTEEAAITYLNQSYCPIDTSNVTWLSKHDSTIIKSQITELEPELKDIFQAFKNSVIIEVLPKSAIRTKVQNTTVGNDTGKKNFKKFKKVMPLKPHTTSITSVSQNVSTINEITVITDDEEEEEIQRRRPMKKKASTAKRFAF